MCPTVARDLGPAVVEPHNRIESILDEGQFLTRLARALVRDEHLADDLIQETWLAALKRPPKGDVRSWLAAVAHNLVRRGSQAASNREQRERSVARPELGPSPEEIQRRESVRGLVVEKVLGLPEPYRTAVLLRYFENWKPRRIARETGCSVETIKTRLKRALERLREDLDRENRGERAVWMLTLIRGGRVKPLSVSLTKGALLLSTKAKIAVGILLVVGLAATTFVLSHERERGRPQAAKTLEATELSRLAGPPPSAVQSPDSASIRTAAVETPPSNRKTDPGTGDGSARSTLRLFGSVVLADGRPFDTPETVLELTGRSGKRHRTNIESGRYAFDGIEAGSYVLSSRKPGYKHLDLEVVVDGKRSEQELDLTIERAWTIDVHLVTLDGEDLRSRLRYEPFDLFDQPTILCTTDLIGERLPATLMMNHSREGRSLPAQDPTTGFDSDRIYVQGDPPIHVNVLLRDFVLATREVTTPETEMTFVIGIDRIRALLSGLTLRLVDGETGLPATTGGANLSTDDVTEGEVHPDDQGFVRFQNRLPGRYEVHTFLKGYSFGVCHVDLPPGITTDLGSITFEKGIVVSGRCVDESRTPKRIPMLITPLNALERPGEDPSTTNFIVKADQDGRFSVRNLQRSRYCLRVINEPAGLGQEGESGWSARPILVDTSGGSVEGLVVVVERPRLVILHPTADGVVGTKYAVLTAYGLAATTGEFDLNSSASIDLPKGDYTIRLSRGEKKIRELPLQVAGQTTTVEIDP